MTDEVCGDKRNYEGLEVTCDLPPHSKESMHNGTLVADDGGSTSIGWWTH